MERLWSLMSVLRHGVCVAFSVILRCLGELKRMLLMLPSSKSNKISEANGKVVLVRYTPNNLQPFLESTCESGGLTG